MTIKLYWKDPYLKSCFATVVKVEGNRVWLSQTCFYPMSGGQAGDRGLIQGEKVIDTKLDEAKDVVHIMETAPSIKAKDEVLCQLDWERRYKIMRVHAASHVVDCFLFELFPGLKRLGSNLNEERDSSTYESENPLDEAKLKEVENRANSFIAGNWPIETYDDKEKQGFRWWKCSDFVMPCGGTHPANTNEIGTIVLKRESSGKGKEKIKTFCLSKSSL